MLCVAQCRAMLLLCTGYDYPCQGPAPGVLPGPDVDVCVLQPVSFRGVSCSDAAGSQKCYWEIMSCE